MVLRLTLQTASSEETQEVGRAMGIVAQPGDVFLLTGPLGAGKTCLVQGFAMGLQVEGFVRSPTFVLMSRHQGRLTLHHIDLYRIGDPAEAWDLGIDEQLFDEGVCMVEWADRAADIFPEGCLWVHLDYAPGVTHRTITFSEGSARYRPLLKRLMETFPPARDAGV